MAVINLLSIEPVKACTDLSCYTSFIYGIPKSGKTTLVYDLYKERVLFIATEKRHKVLVGAHVQYITTWADFITVLAQLKNPKIKAMYDVICIDTVENLYKMLESYILQKYGTTEFGAVEWGKDYTDRKTMWPNALQLIEKMGYSPCFVSHATQVTVKIPVSGILETQVNDTMQLVTDKKTKDQYYEFTKYVPDLKDNIMAPINKMVDNILFITITCDQNGNEQRVIHLRETLQWQAGSTFAGIAPVIQLGAEHYKKAVMDAIDLISDDQKYDAKVETQIVKHDYDEIMAEAKKIGGRLIKLKKNVEVQRIIDSAFGPGARLMDAKEHQIEPLYIALLDLRELSEKNPPVTPVEPIVELEPVSDEDIASVVQTLEEEEGEIA